MFRGKAFAKAPKDETFVRMPRPCKARNTTLSTSVSPAAAAAHTARERNSVTPDCQAEEYHDLHLNRRVLWPAAPPSLASVPAQPGLPEPGAHQLHQPGNGRRAGNPAAPARWRVWSSRNDKRNIKRPTRWRPALPATRKPSPKPTCSSTNRVRCPGFSRTATSTTATAGCSPNGSRRAAAPGSRWRARANICWTRSSPPRTALSTRTTAWTPVACSARLSRICGAAPCPARAPSPCSWRAISSCRPPTGMPLPWIARSPRCSWPRN